MQYIPASPFAVPRSDPLSFSLLTQTLPQRGAPTEFSHHYSAVLDSINWANWIMVCGVISRILDQWVVGKSTVSQKITSKYAPLT